jgi:hypothetical protein
MTFRALNVLPILEHASGTLKPSGRGKAWRDIKAVIVALPRVVEILPLPSVGEPFLAWTTSGEAEFQELENADTRTV